jgi:hypothetical protein
MPPISKRHASTRSKIIPFNQVITGEAMAQIGKNCRADRHKK